SEEHTSELQSLTNLVCRLLLEKKKKNENTPTRTDGSTISPRDSGTSNTRSPRPRDIESRNFIKVNTLTAYRSMHRDPPSTSVYTSAPLVSLRSPHAAFRVVS